MRTTIIILFRVSTRVHNTMQYFLSLLLLYTLWAPSVSASDQVEVPLSISADSLPIKYDNVIETVIIENERYQVPEPWTGNRLFPTSRNLEELQQIPKEFTHLESEIYILAEAHPPLLRMLEQARSDGVELKVESAYRSMNYQTRIFIRMLAKGRTFDDIVRYVAPPGYSQHMLGTAMDFYPSNWAFAETEQYRWLQENGPRFGFKETYSKNNRFRMPWEAWHWNYVGEPDIVDKILVQELEVEKRQPGLPQIPDTKVAEGASVKAEAVNEAANETLVTDGTPIKGKVKETTIETEGAEGASIEAEAAESISN